MSTQDQILYGLFGVLIVVLLVVVGTMLFPSSKEDAPARPKPVPGTPVLAGLSSVTLGTTGEGDVEISLTPKGMQNGKFIVNLAANTHSVDLSQFDLSRQTTLVIGGKQYTPSSASTLSGHHAQGSLMFDVSEEPKALAITIRGIPLQEERVFEWK